MSRRLSSSLVIIAIAVIWASTSVFGSPSIGIVDPGDGSAVTSHLYNVTGEASGSNAQWFQGSAADFNAGLRDDVAIQPNGGLQLIRKVSDDFDDNALNTSVWARIVQSGVNVVEESSGLHFKGMHTGSGDWGGWAKVTSINSVSMTVQATLGTFSGAGDGSRTRLMLYQDASNYVSIGELHDDMIGLGVYMFISCSIDGVVLYETWDEITSHPQTYKVAQSDGAVVLYRDDSEIKSIDVTLTNPKVVLMGEAKAPGDTVDVRWDNLASEYISAGMLTSSVHDTRAVGPVLQAVHWNSSTSTDAIVDVEVRSSSTADMSDPSSWSRMVNGQTSEFPSVYRYLQYRAILSTTDPLASPTLWNVTLTYNKPVDCVEVRAGETTDWVRATGRDNWWVWLDLPEETTTIHARVTDVAGEVAETSSTIDVDTTPPHGSVLIGGGEPSTKIRTVTLLLDASDRYGVSDMMVSELEGFSDTIWSPYEPQVALVLSPGDGIKTVYVKFRDCHGLESEVVSAFILLDTSAPIGRLSIDNGAVLTNSSVVRLSLNATDASGVESVMVGERPDFAGAEWQSFTENLDFTLSSQDGVKTVYAIFRDTLGHVSEAVLASIILDTSPPSVGLTIAGGAAYTASVQVMVDLEVGEVEGIAALQVGEDAALLDAPKEPFRTPYEWTFQHGDGQKHLYARVWDLAGNAGPIAFGSIFLDTLSPTTGLEINGGAAYTTSHLVALTIEASDASPLGTMELDDEPAFKDSMPRAFSSSTDFVLGAGDGPRAVYARVRDAAGNMGPVATAIIIVDATAPSLVMSMGFNGTYTTARNVSINLTVTDAEGVTFMQVGEDMGLAGVAYVPYEGELPWTLSEGDGQKHVYARVMDVAGNIGEIVSCTVVLDSAPPLSSLTPMQNISTTTDIEVSWQGVDATSGIALYDLQCQTDGGPWIDLAVRTTSTQTTFKAMDGHSYSFRVRAVDLAGNLEAYQDLGAVSVTVDVPEDAKGFTLSLLNLIIILAIAAVCIVGVALAMGRLGRKEP